MTGLSAVEWLAVSPLLVVFGLAMLAVLLDIVAPGNDRLVTAVTIVGIVGAMALVGYATWGQDAAGQTAFGGAYVRDRLTGFLDLVFLSIALLTVFFSPDYLRPRRLPMAEFSSTLLFAISGAMLLGGSRDLLVLFLGLELMVLPGYMLAGYAKRDGLSTEGAIKYFLLGSFSSAIFLFGLALVWGFTGTTNIPAVAAVLTGLDHTVTLTPALTMGLALLTAGVAFKIAAVPFHYWTPDAYQGSPTPVTGYLSVGPKIGAFALILRLFIDALAPLKADWTPFIVVLAALTMTLGNLVALTQDNIKRMLAYSSIAHTGYILVGLAAYAAAPVGSDTERAGLEALLFYSAAYTFMNLGAFAVVTALQRRTGVTSQISTFGGLGRRAPLLGGLMFLFLLSLTGIPPLAGFWAKVYVILAALQAGSPWLTGLAVLTVVNAAMAAFYYLRVAVVMYMREPSENAAPVQLSGLVSSGLVLSAVLTVLIGVAPGVVILFAQEAARALL